MTKLIVLDRDGVINEDSDQYIKSPEEFIPIPGSLDAISRLNKAGYTVVVATNQSGIARGYFDMDTLAQMHKKLSLLLEKKNGSIDNIYICPHGPDDNCSCRKPKPDLLLRILKEYQVEPCDVTYIGDSLKDLQVARTVKMVPVLVRTGKGMKTETTIFGNEEYKVQFADVKIYDNLAQAVQNILEQ